MRSFNEPFGNIDWKDADKIRKVIGEEISNKVAADTACQNADEALGYAKRPHRARQCPATGHS